MNIQDKRIAKYNSNFLKKKKKKERSMQDDIMFNCHFYELLYRMRSNKYRGIIIHNKYEHTDFFHLTSIM